MTVILARVVAVNSINVVLLLGDLGQTVTLKHWTHLCVAGPLQLRCTITHISAGANIFSYDQNGLC